MKPESHLKKPVRWHPVAAHVLWWVCAASVLTFTVLATTGSRAATAVSVGKRSPIYIQMQVQSQIHLPDTGAHPLYLINDSISRINPLSIGDIGLIEIVQPDSAAVRYGTRNVVRVYTKEFVLTHQERFPGVPMIAPDTIANPGTSEDAGKDTTRP